jgi:hypothetical protein
MSGRLDGGRIEQAASGDLFFSTAQAKLMRAVIANFSEPSSARESANQIFRFDGVEAVYREELRELKRF